MLKFHRHFCPLLFLFILVLASVFENNISVSGLPVRDRISMRRDPMHGFKRYNGVYNVTNIHYWASTAFTGVHGYAIAVAWLLLGLVFSIYLTCKKLLSSSPGALSNYTDNHYMFTFLFIVFLTCLAIVATSLVLAANERSLHRTNKLKGSIVKAGEDTRQVIHKVVNTMIDMRGLLRPYDPGTSTKLDTVGKMLSNDSILIEDFITNSGHAIDTAIQAAHTSHIVVGAVNLFVLVISIVTLLLHWHPGFIMVIIAFWILATVGWLLTGIDFFVHNFVDDTCRALQDFEQHPQNNSLSSVVTCMEPSFSSTLMSGIGSTIHAFISQLNVKISDFYPMNFASESEAERTGSRSPGVVQICDPFSGAPNFTYKPESCPQDSISIGSLPKILSYLTCFRHNSTSTCRTQRRIIPEPFYYMVSAYSNSIQDMLNILPDLETLTKCTIVKMTFSDVVKHQCKNFKVSTRLLWVSMLCLSSLTVALAVSWVFRGYSEFGRAFSRFCVGPIREGR